MLQNEFMLYIYYIYIFKCISSNENMILGKETAQWRPKPVQQYHLQSAGGTCSQPQQPHYNGNPNLLYIHVWISQNIHYKMKILNVIFRIRSSPRQTHDTRVFKHLAYSNLHKSPTCFSINTTMRVSSLFIPIAYWSRCTTSPDPHVWRSETCVWRQTRLRSDDALEAQQIRLGGHNPFRWGLQLPNDAMPCSTARL